MNETIVIDVVRLNAWLNVATILAIAGLVAFLGCLGSSTFWDGK